MQPRFNEFAQSFMIKLIFFSTSIHKLIKSTKTYNFYNYKLSMSNSQFQTTQANLNEKTIGKTDTKSLDPLEQAIQELEIKVTDPDDKKEIKKILLILQYPSTTITDIHVSAHRLGNRDEQTKGSTPEVKKQYAETAVMCPCCSMIKQEDQLKLCHSLDDISNLGLSTFLYFQSIKNLAIILIEMLLIYAIFAFATNIVASGKYTTCGSIAACSAKLDYLAISLGSKQLNATNQNNAYYYIQCWIGVGMVVIWFITFSILKYYEKVKEMEVDQESTTASDFTILIEGFPEDITEKQFLDQLKVYEKKVHNLTNIPIAKKKPFNVKKFNKGKAFIIKESDFKDQELQKLQQENNKMKQQMAEWILERQSSHAFSQTKEQMNAFYKKYEENIEAQKKRMTHLSDQMKAKMNQENSEQNPVFFVTLDSNLAKNLIVGLNPREMSARIRNFLTCANTGNKFDFNHKGNALSLIIERAPEPQDIIWANIGLTNGQKLCRKFITFTVTLIILGLSFLAVYGLSVAQISSSNNRFLSILISLTISLINMLISQAIKYQSLYERDYTTIKYQTSLAIKSIMASLVNSILIPIIANRFIKNNIYEKNGLADDIFMLGLTNAFVPPVLKFIDGGYFFSKFMKWRMRSPTSKLYTNQIQHNAYQTKMEFEIGYEYVYVVHLYLFACFFVSLQPIVCLFAVFGYLLMFWAQKWALFNRMRRPIPGNDLINTALSQLVFLGPIIYSLGSLTWVNFFPEGTPKYAILPNLIALGISVIMWLLPLSLIFSCCLSEKQEKQIKYDETRIFIPTEYDRLNPSTAAEGAEDYQKYIENYMKNMKGKSQEQQQRMGEMLMRQQQRGVRPNMPTQPLFAPPGMMNFFAPPPQPFMMAPQMMPMNPMMPMMSPSPMMMNPMMPMMNPMMQRPFQPMQPFNPFGSGMMNSGFSPQPAPFVPPVQQFQPQPKPVIQQTPPPFIPPNPNVNGFGQPQNQYAPVGFNNNQPQGFNQPPQGFNQPPQGFNQPPPGFGQPPQVFGQPPQGFGQPQNFNQPHPPGGFNNQRPGLGQPFNPFNM